MLHDKHILIAECQQRAWSQPRFKIKDNTHHTMRSCGEYVFYVVLCCFMFLDDDNY